MVARLQRQRSLVLQPTYVIYAAQVIAAVATRNIHLQPSLHLQLCLRRLFSAVHLLTQRWDPVFFVLVFQVVSAGWMVQLVQGLIRCGH